MAFKLKLPAFSKTKQAGSKTKQAGSKTRPSGETDVSAKPLPLIGHLPFGQQLKVLGGGILISLLVGIVAAALDYRATSQGAHYIELSDDLMMLTQRLAKDAASALQGGQIATEGLPLARAEAEHILESLDKGDEMVPPTSGEPRVVLQKLLPVARQSLGYIKDIEVGRPGILTVARAVDAVKEVGPLLREDMGQLLASGVDNARVNRLALLLERIGKDVNEMLGGTVTMEQVALLGSDTIEAEDLLSKMDQSNPTVAKVSDLFLGYRNSVEAVISQALDLHGAKKGGSDYFDSVSQNLAGGFLVEAEALNAAYRDALKGRWTIYALVFSAVLLMAFMALLAQVYLADARQVAGIAERTNKQNQNAILRLMNEMGDLADGDLTVRATVTEDVTGAIADSLNYTTEEFRKLVSRIMVAVEQMGHATKSAEDVSKGLLDAAQKQAKEINDAGEAVQLMARSIKEVDSSATQSANVARRTLVATEQGAQAVRNTISGMDSIREQIQDTSKRIKRLGESSQEIGEIVDLISDITEQTNVLALNAAIQAASAGEAGRGFSVVAEEVQRLAERSGEATKQIGALVKTIQGDTHDAVAAMEKSTLGVVEGAKLSDMAGQSLREIEQVSNELAALINSISTSTQVQTDMAGEVASVMQEILQITVQTTEGTRLTANSIAQLTVLTSDLSASVAGFKL